MNLKLKLSFGLGEKGNWNVNPDKAIETIKATYYLLKKKELEDELNEKERIVKDFNPNNVYEKCLTTLRSEVAKKYDIPCLNFLLTDKKELMSDNQLLAIGKVVEEENIQFVASILKDKLPDDLQDKRYYIVELSEHDKLFRF